MSNPAAQVANISTGPDVGIYEIGIPCDPTGFIGTAGIQNGVSFNDVFPIYGVPQAVAGVTGAVYYSFIHGAAGSDVRNSKAQVTGREIRPAFANPEVNGFFSSGPNERDPLKNGYMNTEKILRSRSDSQDPSKDDATVWVPTLGKTRLAGSLWVGQAGVNQDFYTLEVYRDINNQDKGVGVFGGLATDILNAQLIYQYGPFKGNQILQPYHNAAFGPVDILAGCNLYIILRNLNDNAAINFVNGSLRFV